VSAEVAETAILGRSSPGRRCVLQARAAKIHSNTVGHRVRVASTALADDGTIDAQARALAADKILDVTNLISAAVVIGWVLGEPSVSLWTLGVVVGLWAVAFGIAMIVEFSDD
jgi:hypothetical protein